MEGCRIMNKQPTNPRERLALVEAQIARLQRKANSGLTCCGEIGGIRSRSQKRKNQISDMRVSVSVQLCKLYPIRDSLRATVARIDRGEPEPVIPPSVTDLLRRSRRQRVIKQRVPMMTLAPRITALCGNMETANAYMMANDGEGLLAEMPDGKCYMARVDDMGERVTREEFTARVTPKMCAIMQAAGWW